MLLVTICYDTDCDDFVTIYYLPLKELVLLAEQVIPDLGGKKLTWAKNIVQMKNNVSKK